jgi:hypothetical protein
VDDVRPRRANSVPSAPLTLVGASPQPGRRRFTDRHAALLRDPELLERAEWSATALWACLEHLRFSTVTQAARAAVVDAWLDGPDAFCVLYRPPFDEARVVGLCRCRQEALEAREWRLGDMTAWGYDMTSDMTSDDGTRGLPGDDLLAFDADWVDPVAFGWNVADFDIGEPLGFVATILRYDRGDIGWWGSLGVALPSPPRMAE